MPDLARLPALATAPRGAFGPAPAALVLTALPEGPLWQVLGTTPDAVPDPALGPRANGPGDWYVPGAPREALPAGATVIDQGHGRVPIRLSGTPVLAALAKGSGADLAALAPGDSAVTLLGHVSVHLTRTAPDAVELLVPRSYAVAVWEDLIAMGREFGLETAG